MPDRELGEARDVESSSAGDHESNSERSAECNRGATEEFDVLRWKELEICGGFKAVILIRLEFNYGMGLESIEYNCSNNGLILFIKNIPDIVLWTRVTWKSC